MSYNDFTLTGYFVSPTDSKYVHVWEIKINPAKRYVYSDTLREVMLASVDGYRFPADVILTMDAGELNKAGFYIPEEAKDHE
jgi:hypothetical protein